MVSVHANTHAVSGTYTYMVIVQCIGLVLYGKLMLIGHWGWCQCMRTEV